MLREKQILILIYALAAFIQLSIPNAHDTSTFSFRHNMI
jgi:hypothetical protein